MENISKDLHNPHWWFNIIIGIILVIVTYTITEFIIKPMGTKGYFKANRQTNYNNKSINEIVTRVNNDQREEMRMNFTLIHIKQTIYFKLAILVILIPAVIVNVIFNDFWPIRLAFIVFGTWSLYHTVRDIPKLIKWQNYYFDILSKVEENS